MNKPSLISIIILTGAILVSPLYAQNTKKTTKSEPTKTEEPAFAQKTDSPFYAGLSLPFGFTFALGSFETTDKAWNDNKIAFGVSLYGGYKYNETHHFELFLSYMKEEAVAVRSYNAIQARSVFEIYSIDCALLYRYNISNYSIKIGPAFFMPDIKETVYIHNSSQTSTVGSETIVFGAFIALTEYFKIYDNFTVSLSLYAKIPITNYTEETDKFGVLTTGLALGCEYYF